MLAKILMFLQNIRKAKEEEKCTQEQTDACSFPPATADQRTNDVLQDISPCSSLGLLSIVVCHRYPIQHLWHLPKLPYIIIYMCIQYSYCNIPMLGLVRALEKGLSKWTG